MKTEEKYLGKVNETITSHDELLRGITVGELIDTVYSNEKVHDEKTIKKVWKELLKVTMIDAEHELKTSMKYILDSLNK